MLRAKTSSAHRRGRSVREVKEVAHRGLYTQGAYLENNPTRHVEDSPWKAQQIIKMMKRDDIRPRTVCEVGCGPGEVLRQLQLGMDCACIFWGYEISPVAFDLSRKKANERQWDTFIISLRT
jgi:ubiquinone/menaquinone biosynthesis C-methylase UbiE